MAHFVRVEAIPKRGNITEPSELGIRFKTREEGKIRRERKLPPGDPKWPGVMRLLEKKD